MLAQTKSQSQRNIKSAGSLPSTSPAVLKAFSNHLSKLTLLLQTKDPSNSGLVTLEDFETALQTLEDAALTDAASEVLEYSNAKSGNSVKYRMLLDTLRRHKVSARPMSSRSSASIRTDYTSNYDRSAVAPLARLLWEKKLSITQIASQNGQRSRLKQPSSAVLSVLKKAGVNVNIHQLKALLRELNINFEEVSILELIQQTRTMLHLDSSSEFSLSSSMVSRAATPVASSELLDKVRNWMYTRDPQEVFFKCRDKQNVVSLQDFINTVTELSGGRLRAIEVKTAFERASRGRSQLTKDEFFEVFRKHEPDSVTLKRCYKTIRNWLRSMRLSSADSWNKILEVAGSAASVLNITQFLDAMDMFSFNSHEAELLFKNLDSKCDGLIDINEWQNKLSEEDGVFLILRDVIVENQLEAEDLLIKMNLRDRQRLTAHDFAMALQRLDRTLTPSKAAELAIGACGSKGWIDVQDLLLHLSLDVMDYSGNWNETILKKIEQKITHNPSKLMKLFEDRDLKHSGKLALADFQDCIYNADLGLKNVEIERLARILDREGSRLVDYVDFLEKMRCPGKPKADLMRSSVDRLIIFIRQNELNVPQLLKRLKEPVSIEKFTDFLASKVHKRQDRVALSEVAAKLDINRDGFISEDDLNAVLANQNRMTLKSTPIFPTAPIETERARSVIKEVRNALVARRINYRDAFNLFDVSQKGLLTSSDFISGLSKIIDLSQPVKEGLFAIMDKQKIGLVDFNSFIAVLKDGLTEAKQHGDNWDWEDMLIRRIKSWIQTEGLTIENAFRAFDKDFDGVISKYDLKNSLVTLLKVEEREIPPSRLDRLYKLLDTYKRGGVQLADFKLLFEEGSQTNWLHSAKQQLGLHLSKSFPSLEASFESVAERALKVTFAQFQTYVETSQALKGFNLTQELLTQLYAWLDPHRKGFLSLQDWQNAFKGHDSNSQIVKELKDAVRTNFKDPQAAFDYFLSYKQSQTFGKVDFLEFEKAVNSLIPSRFTRTEIEKLWEKIARGKSMLGFEDFGKSFESARFISTFAKSSSRRATTSAGSIASRPISAPMSITSLRSVLSQEGDPIKSFTKIVQVSPLSLEEIFKELDRDGSGKISQIEFRNAIRKLNLGLTSRDIDTILLRVDSNNDGQIDWQEFIAHFRQTETGNRIKAVSRKRLDKLSEMMLAYMLTPKDAFRQFDPERSGRLTYASFTALVNKLHSLANEPAPSFTVVKDLFELIDIRSDGYLDIKEWMNSFRRNDKPTWEDSKEFEVVSFMISKHRKLLQSTFDHMSGSTGYVLVTAAKDVLTSSLRELKLNDEQWNRVLKPAIHEDVLDYRSFLDIYKTRATTANLHPRPI